MMNVFRFVVLEKCRRSSGLRPDLLQPLQDVDQLVGGKYASIFQRARVGAAGCEFVLQQTPVKAERPLPALEVRVQRLPEPPRPHLHQPTSTRDRAREREGSPRMRMNPAASFWSYSAPMVNDERSVRYNEYSDSRLTIETLPLYKESETLPVMNCCVFSTNASSASRSGVNHKPK